MTKAHPPFSSGETEKKTGFRNSWMNFVLWNIVACHIFCMVCRGPYLFYFSYEISSFWKSSFFISKPFCAISDFHPASPLLISDQGKVMGEGRERLVVEAPRNNMELVCLLSTDKHFKTTSEIQLFKTRHKGSPTEISVTSIWALPVRGEGGGLNPCPDGLGHFFREEFSKFKWAFPWFWGGLNPCQDGLGQLCSENWS